MTGTHRCPVRGCTARVPDSRFTCPDHWRLASKATRRRVLHAWLGRQHGRPGATREHVQALADAMREINAALSRAERDLYAVQIRRAQARLCQGGASA